MQTLAGSVGDLKRVMTNVKTRGTWGELQLGAIIENVLTPEQYARNVKTVPGSDDMVEFAIRLPGRSDETPVWLPIDAKYPVEQYQRLLDAQDAADKAAIASAGNAFEASIKFEARKIHGKYVSPPTPRTLPCSTCPRKACLPRSCAAPAWSRPYRTAAA